jgi:hypothetical protein
MCNFQIKKQPNFVTISQSSSFQNPKSIPISSLIALQYRGSLSFSSHLISKVQLAAPRVVIAFELAVVSWDAPRYVIPAWCVRIKTKRR